METLEKWKARFRKDKKYRNFLLKMLPKNGAGAEIGVFAGEFSEKLFSGTKPKVLHLIDPWKIKSGKAIYRAPYGRGSGLTQADMNYLHKAVRKKFDKYVKLGRIVIDRGTSVKILNKLPDSSFDWVYIDGDHRYTFVKRDLELSHRKVKNGGIISGDDYGPEGWHKEIKRAVDEFIAQGKCKKIITKNEQFILLNIK